MPTAFQEIGKWRVSGSIRAGTLRGQRQYLTEAATLTDFLTELEGGWRIIGGTTTRIPGATFPGFPSLVVVDWNAEPFLPDPTTDTTLSTLSSALSSYISNGLELIQVNVQYGPRQGGEDNSNGPSIPEGTYLTIEGDIGGESLTIPGTSFKWAEGTDVGDPLPEDAPPDSVFVGIQNFTLTWSRVPQPPWSSMASLLNKVNDATFMNHAAGYVLYQGADFNRTFQVSGDALWTLRYKFAARSVKWNASYNKTDSAFLEFEKDDGNPFFTLASFNPLFAFGT